MNDKIYKIFEKRTGIILREKKKKERRRKKKNVTGKTYDEEFTPYCKMITRLIWALQPV